MTRNVTPITLWSESSTLSDKFYAGYDKNWLWLFFNQNQPNNNNKVNLNALQGTDGYRRRGGQCFRHRLATIRRQRRPVRLAAFRQPVKPAEIKRHGRRPNANRGQGRRSRALHPL